MSLTSDDLADIKQLMEAVISAAITEQNSRIDAKFAKQDEKFAEHDEKLDEILNVVGEDLAKRTSKLDDHAVRITRLEAKVA